MGDLSIDKIILATVFFIPGFIYLKAYRLFISEVRTDFSKDLYEAIGFSFLNAIFFAYPLFLITSIRIHPFWYFSILLFIIVIAPLSCAYLYYKISKKKWFSKYMISPTKSAWDSFFSRRESYFVIITLKNGNKIAGKYGLNSFSSTYPNHNEIYIQEVWKLNEKGLFDEIVEQTQGMLITENEISTIEFFI